MGSSGSKASRSVAGAAARKYPSRPSPNTTTSTAPSATTNAPPTQPSAAPRGQAGPTVRPQPHASGTRDDAINLDASDPDFARSLRQLGAVQPNPTLSQTSIFPHPNNPNNPSTPSTMPPIGPDPRMNPALAVLQSRSRIQDLADREFVESGKRGHPGREFLDVSSIRQILQFRDERGTGAQEIERRLGLKAGVVGRLGVRGVVGVAAEMSQAKGVDMV